MQRGTVVSLAIVAGMAMAPPAQAITKEKFEQAIPEKLAKLEVHPPAVELTTPYAYSQLLITGTLSSGETADVTRMAKIASSSPVVEVSPTGFVRSRQDGQAELTITLGNQTAKITVKVTGQKDPYHPSFVQDIEPVLAKAGCNAGTCHGSKEGKNGFKLSLRGYDPLYDHRSLTDDIGARRFNRADPGRSLMLLKPTGVVPHQGGVVLTPGDRYYEMIRAWIADGVKLDLEKPRVTGIEVFPKKAMIPLPQMTQQVKVIATFSDGATRDVTAEAFIEPSNIEVLAVDRHGLVTALRRGEAAALVRYDGAYGVSPMIVMGDRTGYAWNNPPAYNYVDELVYQKQREVKVLPGEVCTDAEFIRRLYLDLTGLPPTADEVRAFLADTTESRAKRDALIDKLIGSPEYIEHWTNKWADMLQVNAKFLGNEGAAALRNWIKDSLSQKKPYDQFVYEVLTASGSNMDNPPAAYYKRLRDPDEAMENTTQLFLSIRFNCNKCHDHPFERWTQDQYYHLASYFAQVGRAADNRGPYKGKTIGGTAVMGKQPLVEIISDTGKGDVKHERTGEVTPPEFPYQFAALEARATPADAQQSQPQEPPASRREALARWLTHKENPYFARSYVNRIWSYLLGVGLIEPVDDIRAGNPPTNAALLSRLTEEFVSSGLNVQELMRTICKSRTYQLSIATNEWNEDDDLNYSHAIARRLPAEVLYDAIYRVTGTQTRLPGLPAGARAAQMVDPNQKLKDGFLDQFGRPPRESACECERSSGVLLGPVMNLIMGPTLNDALVDPKNAIAQLVSKEPDDAKLVQELFLRILNRPATETEVAAAVEMMQGLPAAHERLAAELATYEAGLAERIAEDEKKRQERIAQAEQALSDYRQAHAAREAELDKQQQERTAKLTTELQQYEQTLPAKLAEWEKAQQSTSWTTLDPIELAATNGATLTKEADLSVFASGKNGIGSYKFIARTDLAGITGVRLELFADKRLPKNGPGRSPSNGNFVLTEFRVEAAPEATPDQNKPIELQNAQADFSQNGYSIASAIDKQEAPQGNGWATAPRMGQNRTAVFETKEDTGAAGGTRLTFWLDQKYKDATHSLGRFRISLTTAPRPLRLEGLPGNIGAILALPADQRNDQQQAELLNYFRGLDEELKKRQQAVAESQKPRPPDPQLKQLEQAVAVAKEPLPPDPKLAQLKRDLDLSAGQLANSRLTAAQDLAWALINSPAFIFNR